MGTRKIYNVRYMVGAARIYDETHISVGTQTAANNTDEGVTISADMSYVDVKSYSFNNSSSTTGGGVPSTLHAGIPVIVGDSIQIGPEITIPSFEWSQTMTDSTNVEVPGSIYVPPRSMVTISYVGTRGTCDVPFSYTLRDTSSAGAIIETVMTDGIFKGSNYYNFKFVESDG